MADKKTVATGERFIPEVKDAELEMEHLERYLCIKELVRNKVVLDAACGEGYGSHILSQTAASVLGIDIDIETIQRAKDKYGVGEKLDYKQASVTNLSMVPSGSIEVVVSYETIEHIDEESQIKFLQEISRVLKPDGILIMSTPDKEEYSDKYEFHNPFHVKEFYIREFVDFLHMQFKNVKLYNQYLEVASFIDCPEEKIEKIQYSINKERYKAVAKYVIAIACNIDLPKQSIAMAFMHLRREYMPMMEELNYCRKEAIECRKKVEKLDECLNENKLIHEELDRREVELQNRMNVINELRKKNIESEQIRKEQYEELNRRSAELNHRMDEINLRDQKIEKQKNEIKLFKEELERREVELEHRMDEINLRDQEIARQKNEIRLSKEELSRREVELNHRMDEINFRDQEIVKQKHEIKLINEELEQLKKLDFIGIMKWFLNKNN